MKDVVIYIAFAIELLFIGYLFYCAFYVNRTPMYKPKKDKKAKGKEMSKNLYKDYYDAMNAPDADEWAIERAKTINKKIKRVREYASLNGISEEAAMAEMNKRNYDY